RMRPWSVTIELAITRSPGMSKGLSPPATPKLTMPQHPPAAAASILAASRSLSDAQNTRTPPPAALRASKARQGTASTESPASIERTPADLARAVESVAQESVKLIEPPAPIPPECRRFPHSPAQIGLRFTRADFAVRHAPRSIGIRCQECSALTDAHTG